MDKMKSILDRIGIFFPAWNVMLLLSKAMLQEEKTETKLNSNMVKAAIH